MSRLLLALLAVLAVAWTPRVLPVAGIGPTLIVSHGSVTPPPPPGPPVTGYTIWLDATYSGNTSSTWVDQSGNGYNATVVGGGTNPTLTPGAINGLQAYRFDGVNNRMSTPAVAIPTNFTLFVVFQMIVSNNADALVDANRGNGFLVTYNAGAPSQGWYNGSATASGSAANTSTHVMMLTRSSSTGTFSVYLDGTLSGTVTSTASTATNARSLAYWATITSVGANVWLCEYVEYASFLTGPQVTAMNTYLSGKWI